MQGARWECRLARPGSRLQRSLLACLQTGAPNRFLAKTLNQRATPNLESWNLRTIANWQLLVTEHTCIRRFPGYPCHPPS